MRARSSHPIHRWPFPEVYGFFDSSAIKSFHLVVISFTLDLFDTFLHASHLLLQLVSVTFQPFLFLLGGEETAEPRATPATAGAPCRAYRPLTWRWLTHPESPPDLGNPAPLDSRVPSIAAWPRAGHASALCNRPFHNPNAALAISCRSHSDVLKCSVSPRASRKSRSTI